MEENGSHYPHSLFHQPKISLLKDLMLALNGLGMRLEIIGASKKRQSDESSFYVSILRTEGCK
jgi:predicted nuclease of restriction endonuclease-like (RecB) superfamily